MRFLSIELENFRQYKEKQKIEFSGGDSNFTIIQAPNGAGKTNLLSSIFWCLYGEEENSSSKYKTNKTLPMLNELTGSSLKPGKQAQVSVKIILGEEIAEYVIERIHIFRKNSNDDVDLIDESFKILTYHEGGFIEEQNIDLAINRILPKEVKNFFFFDGEKLDSFFKIGSGVNIKKAVFDVSQIGLLKNTIAHLEAVKKDVLKNHVDVNPQITEHQEGINIREDKLSEEKEAKLRFEISIEEANNQINIIDEYLRDHSLPQVKEKQKQREFYEQAYKDNLIKIDEIKKNRINLFLDIGPTIILKKTIKCFIDKIEQLDRDNSLPPDISNLTLNKILKKKECICGNCISEGSKEAEHILSLFNKEDYGDNVKLLLEGNSELSQGLDESRDYSVNLKKLYAEIETIEKKNMDIKESLNEIKVYLEGIDVDEVSRKEAQRTGLFNNVQKLNQYLALSAANISDLEDDLKEQNHLLARLIGKQSQSAEFGFQVELFDQSLRIVKDILNEIVEEVRTTIEVKTNEYFLNLIWKVGAYKKVKIDDDYNLSVINKYENECLGSLSAGERQVLALSFMAALKEVSGFNIPVVIDTPLGRISGDPRISIAKSLPGYLQDTQVTLLMTDTEYTPQLRKILSDRTGKEYLIKFNEETGESKVV